MTLKVRKLQTAEDQKYFEVVRIKKIFPLSLLIYTYMYLDCVRRSSWSTTTLDTLTKVLEAAKKYGDDVVEILKEDLKSSLECMEKQDYKKEEIFNTSLTQSCQNMIVVKLKSGSILLYAPVRMHKENPELILSWTESLGLIFATKNEKHPVAELLTTGQTAK